VNWLYQQRIALTGADTWSFGPVPGEDPERPFLVPQTMYVKMGLFGLENLATEESRPARRLRIPVHPDSRQNTRIDGGGDRAGGSVLRR
jgi:hypothetical protein